MENVKVSRNGSSKKPVVGIFDSGIGGFSILAEVIKALPEASLFYYSDDAHAPYGPKSDEFITKRSFAITDELLKQGASVIVVACNTATAASIDALRQHYPQLTIVGVEPFLNAYYKGPKDAKMVVLTTESTGKSERFKRLKERLDPEGNIDHFSLKNLARLVEEFYYHPDLKKDFENALGLELLALKEKGYTHAILGCTHYPLVSNYIEEELNLKTVSPCPYVASRVKDLAKALVSDEKNEEEFNFYSSRKPGWIKKSRQDFLGPFKK